jgi:heme-degrading monooxygenase HmoA
MYSRVTQLEIDTMRVDVDEAAWLFREHVMPRLREQEGYEGAVALATPEGKGMIVTFWDTEEGARDASGFASTELER